MDVVKVTIILLVVILLVSPVAAAYPMPDSGDIEAEGPVDSYEQSKLTVNGVTFLVNEETLIITGRDRAALTSLDDTIVGAWASVSGYTDTDGQVVARKVKIKQWWNETPDSEEKPDEEDTGNIKPEHPVAKWLADRFSLDYSELMAMHEAGIGWGTLIKAYHLAQVYPNKVVDGMDLVDRRLEGEGWGNITREMGIHPGRVPPAWGRHKERNPNTAPKH